MPDSLPIAQNSLHFRCASLITDPCELSFCHEWIHEAKECGAMQSARREEISSRAVEHVLLTQLRTFGACLRDEHLCALPFGGIVAPGGCLDVGD